MNNEIDLMDQNEVDASLELWAIHQARRIRREQRTRWARTWGLAILAGILIGEVIALGKLAGSW